MRASMLRLLTGAVLALGWCAGLHPAAARSQPSAPAGADDATADVKVRVLVLPTRWTGDVPAVQRESVATQFNAGLESAHSELVIDVNEPCLASMCRMERARESSADLLVELAVAVVDRDYRITAVLYEGANGEPLAEVAEPCRICGMVEVAALAGDQGVALRSKISSLEGTAPVTIESRPSGARVRVDTEVLGETPIALRLREGDHDVALELDGRVTVRRHIRLVARVHELIAVVLPPLAKIPAAAVPEPGLSVADRRRQAAWVGSGSAVLVLGVAAVASSVPLFLLHGEPAPDCSGVDVDFAGNCRRVMNTQPGAIALAVVGSVAIATGIGLLVRGTRDLRRRARLRTAR